MKKVYSTPCASAEEFVANEYVAVCWGVACVGGKGDSCPEKKFPNGKWDGSAYGSNCYDHTGSCTNSLNNRIIDGNTMQENSSDQGWINGYFDGFEDSNGNGSIDDGELVYWHTFSGNKDRRWNHCGYAKNVSASHPHHS